MPVPVRTRRTAVAPREVSRELGDVAEAAVEREVGDPGRCAAKPLGGDLKTALQDVGIRCLPDHPPKATQQLEAPRAGNLCQRLEAQPIAQMMLDEVKDVGHAALVARVRGRRIVAWSPEQSSAHEVEGEFLTQQRAWIREKRLGRGQEGDRRRMGWQAAGPEPSTAASVDLPRHLLESVGIDMQSEAMVAAGMFVSALETCSWVAEQDGACGHHVSPMLGSIGEHPAEHHGY